MVCRGGRDAKPMLQGLIDRWLAFHRLPLADNNARIHIKKLTEFLWSHRENRSAWYFVSAIREKLLDNLIAGNACLVD